MEIGTERREGNTIFKGTKEQIRRIVLEKKTLSPKMGFEILIGRNGYKDIITTYVVNPETGEISSTDMERNVVQPIDDQYRLIPTKMPRTGKKCDTQKVFSTLGLLSLATLLIRKRERIKKRRNLVLQNPLFPKK